jgi:hypothetical protein
MSLLRGTRRALLGGKSGVTYLLRATFDAADQGFADAQVLDTFAEGIRDGQLTVVEVDGTLAIVSNKCAFTAQATPTWGDQGFYSQAITRSLGRGLLATINVTATAGQKHLMMEWAQSATIDFAGGGNLETGFYLLQDGGLAANFATDPTVTLSTYVASTDYSLAVVLGGSNSSAVPYYSGQAAASYLYGAHLFIKGGAFTTWTLLWITRLENTATLYPAVSDYSHAGTIDDFRVPDVDLSAVLQPTCLSTFTAANGTSLDAITPEVGGAWTEQSGDWDVQSNRANPDGAAIATVDSGLDDAIVDSAILRRGLLVSPGRQSQ